MEYLFGMRCNDFVLLAADKMAINRVWFLKKGKNIFNGVFFLSQ